MDYFERMQRRLDGKEPFVPGFLGAKNRVRQIADLMGVRTPRILKSGSIAQLMDGDLPNEFVLKPSFASTSLGVRLLRKTRDGFRDLVTGDDHSREEIIGSANEINTRYFGEGEGGDFFIEELLLDRQGNFPPDDIRVYSFQGEVGMVLMEQHLSSPAKAMYFDGDFLPFPDVHLRYGVADNQEHLEEIVEAKTPEHWREILNVARRISCAMPTAFCRVDLYDTPNGVYLGEITFYPGTFITRTRKIMSQSEAERLGRIWGDAEDRLSGSLELKYGSQIRDVVRTDSSK
ncbi:hypothetical protein I6I57_01215 [Brevibacterium casei]|uniref:ATP-grasp fold amidoligase family protein n=1 Tax=Brevibacterium casei TaxID=33889 RepID=UPI001919A9D1|nr:ATP-grasp fold amidoligase family protein [Brevibacterium casei]QQT69586.1 hypothetical protein I6I57_01215 [Brevibacterium casei]